MPKQLLHQCQMLNVAVGLWFNTRIHTAAKVSTTLVSSIENVWLVLRYTVVCACADEHGAAWYRCTHLKRGFASIELQENKCDAPNVTGVRPPNLCQAVHREGKKGTHTHTQREREKKCVRVCVMLRGQERWEGGIE